MIEDMVESGSVLTKAAFVNTIPDIIVNIIPDIIIENVQ